jgi:hypothetical protein
MGPIRLVPEIVEPEMVFEPMTVPYNPDEVIVFDPTMGPIKLVPEIVEPETVFEPTTVP